MKHGAAYAYVQQRCRCELCRAWNTARQEAYRKRRIKREPQFAERLRERKRKSARRRAVAKHTWKARARHLLQKLAKYGPEGVLVDQRGRHRNRVKHPHEYYVALGKLSRSRGNWKNKSSLVDQQCSWCGETFQARAYVGPKTFKQKCCSASCAQSQRSLSRYRLFRNMSHNEMSEKLNDLHWTQGLTTGEIAMLQDVTHGTVVRALRRLGVPKRRRGAVFCQQEACREPVSKVWSVTHNSWWGTRCLVHRTQHFKKLYERMYANRKRRKESELIKLVYSLVPSWIDSQLRSDVLQDVTVAVLSGELPKQPTAQDVKIYISRAFREFANKWGDLSLDQPLGDESNYTLGKAVGVY